MTAPLYGHLPNTCRHCGAAIVWRRAVGSRWETPWNADGTRHECEEVRKVLEGRRVIDGR